MTCLGAGLNERTALKSRSQRGKKIEVDGPFQDAHAVIAKQVKRGLRSASGPSPGGRQGAERAAATKARFPSLYKLALSTNAAPKLRSLDYCTAFCQIEVYDPLPPESRPADTSTAPHCGRSLCVSPRQGVLMFFPWGCKKFCLHSNRKIEKVAHGRIECAPRRKHGMRDAWRRPTMRGGRRLDGLMR